MSDSEVASSRGQMRAAQAADALHGDALDGMAANASCTQHADVDMPTSSGEGLVKPHIGQAAVAASCSSPHNASNGSALAQAPRLASSSSLDAEDLTGQHASSGGVVAQHSSHDEQPMTIGGTRAAESTVLPAHAESVSAAVAALRQGAIVALPTDTLYGLAACANNQQARL